MSRGKAISAIARAKVLSPTQLLALNFRFINDKLSQLGCLGRARLEWRIISDPNILNVCPEFSKKLYPNKGKFTVEQLLKADMVKSAFSAGKRVEHMWVKVSEVQVEFQLVKGTLDNTPTEITHLTFGDIVFVPFKYIEDIWIEGQVPDSVKRLLEIKEKELKAEEFVRSLFEGARARTEGK
jgi:hypothetical protein